MKAILNLIKTSYKAIAGAVVAFLVAVGVVLPNDFETALSGLILALTVFAGVWISPRNQNK